MNSAGKVKLRTASRTRLREYGGRSEGLRANSHEAVTISSPRLPVVRGWSDPLLVDRCENVR